MADQDTVVQLVLVVRELVIRAAKSCRDRELLPGDARPTIKVAFRRGDVNEFSAQVADTGAGYPDLFSWLGQHTGALVGLPASFQFAVATLCAREDRVRIANGDWTGPGGQPTLSSVTKHAKPLNIDCGTDCRVHVALSTRNEASRVVAAAVPKLLHFFRRLALLPNRLGAIISFQPPPPVTGPGLPAAATVLPEATTALTATSDVVQVAAALTARFGHPVTTDQVALSDCVNERDGIAVRAIVAVDVPFASPEQQAQAAAATAASAQLATAFPPLPSQSAAAAAAAAAAAERLPAFLVRYVNGVPLMDTDEWELCQISRAMLNVQVDWVGLKLERSGGNASDEGDGLRFHFREDRETYFGPGATPAAAAAAANADADAAAAAAEAGKPPFGGARKVLILVDVRSDRIAVPFDKLSTPTRTANNGPRVQLPLHVLIGESLARCIRLLTERGVALFAHTRAVCARKHYLRNLALNARAAAKVVERSETAGLHDKVLAAIGSDRSGADAQRLMAPFAEMLREASEGGK